MHDDKMVNSFKWKRIPVFFFIALTVNYAFSQTGFGGYYTRLNTGQDWEAYSRTGEFADLIVRLQAGSLVFWRGNSYLPYWKTRNGQWNLDEIIPRSGDGAGSMPDKVNTYSHVEFIQNTSSLIMVHWRYLANFTAGNPHGRVSPDNFVDEMFTITPDGRVKRVVKKGTGQIDDWNDPSNQTTEVLQLTAKGVTPISRTNPTHSIIQTRLTGNPQKENLSLTPSLAFTFDEGVGDQVKESVTKTILPVPGPKTYWKKGVSGTALEFDGYHTGISLAAGKSLDISGGSLTLTGWFALGAYPWNWVPIVQQGDNDGYFLGVDSHGYPGFMVKVDGIWQQLSVPNKPPYGDDNHLKIFRWYYIAGSYNKADGMMRLYINGEEIASKQIGKGGIQTVNAAVRVGKAGVFSVPTEGTHDTNPSEFGLDGLIDEVRIYDFALSKNQIAASFTNGHVAVDILDHPDMQQRNFPVPATGGKFKAVYAHLPYYETWNNLFRFGQYPDVVVGFDQLPAKFVFWRGVSFIPMMVNESGQWFTEEFNETGGPGAPGDCEPMSDKPSLESHARVIENNNARVVVEWRYRLANPDHYWAHYDSATGWGDIADWYFYIYPDGVASVVMRCYSSRPDAFMEWNEQIAVFGPGQGPESVLRKTPVMTLVDSVGKASSFDWNPDPPKPRYAGNKIQMIHFTGRYSPFAIQHFDGGSTYSNERTWYSVFPTWNHWPIGQTNSSGRTASFPDRAAHSSISNLFWPVYSEQGGKIPFREKLLMQGMTDLPADSLNKLADSWLTAPAVINVSGGSTQGYNQPHRAYRFTWQEAPLAFDIAASHLQPVHNICFEVRNWKNRNAAAILKVNGIQQTPGRGFRQGINIDTDGTYTLIIWAEICSDKPVKFEIANK
jgi:hypothetical protein